MQGDDGWQVSSLLTVGDTIANTSGSLNATTAGEYTPPGAIDGLGAYARDQETVRVLANHELRDELGYQYPIDDGNGGNFVLSGARISYVDVDIATRRIVDAGLAYAAIYDVDGKRATDTSFLPGGGLGFDRFCSGQLVEAESFAGRGGLADRIFFAGEETEDEGITVGGGEWALDPERGEIWHLPDLGRGAWENVTVLDTGRADQVALLLGDDTPPFDADGAGTNEAAPLFLYVGTKDPSGDFPARNGLRGGQLHVWAAVDGSRTPQAFSGSGQLTGQWVEIDNSRRETAASDHGTTGYDDFGYPTQPTLWARAAAAGAFGFSRPEDVATNPIAGNQAVFASTGRRSYAAGVDTFGTVYTITTNFTDMTAILEIVYDGDADPKKRLRSPDNLDWSADGFIYVQEDPAEKETSMGEPLFGPGAVNPTEAGIVRLNIDGSVIERIATIDRKVILDPSTAGTPFDLRADQPGGWESSGLLDVSVLFGYAPGDLFLFDVEAHGIRAQSIEHPNGLGPNPDSRIDDGDLYEGGQLLFLIAPSGA